jgi:type II secretory ATPase GspE/PulE/Tfp pilus assembly ATPase PilB-like protein
VHLQHARGGEAAHQRLAHLGRVGTSLRREQQRFSHRLDVERDDDLVADLAGLAIADAAKRNNIWDLRRAGLAKVMAGLTSIEEINSVTIE